MDLIALAVPFFLLALVAELAIDHFRGTHFYRSNDAINSLSAGTLSTTFGYFTKFIEVFIWASVLQNFAFFQLETAWFDDSARGLALWALAFVGWDLCYYWAHRMGHEVSVLWAAHSVHHQSEDYNLSTALRQTSTGFLFGWIFYLPMFLLGFPLTIVLTVNALNLIYQFWVHTQHINKLGVLDRILVTPSNHRVHHAQNSIYIDRNYGGVFILWDRIFGSFQPELDSEPVIFGVRKPLANWNPFWANAQVYSYLWFDALRTKRWRDKLGIWFRRTGWRPPDVEEMHPRRQLDLAVFTKFDPKVSLSCRRYVFGQFMVAVLAVLLIGAIYAQHGALAVLLPCALLWVQLYTMGLFLEGRSSANLVERIRLLAVMPLGMILMSVTLEGLLDVQLAWLITTIYVLLSMIALQYLGRLTAQQPDFS